MLLFPLFRVEPIFTDPKHVEVGGREQAFQVTYANIVDGPVGGLQRAEILIEALLAPGRSDDGAVDTAAIGEPA